MKKILLLALLTLIGFLSNSQCQDSLYVNGHTLNAGVSGVNYSWYKGDVRVGVPNQIAGANSQTYTPTNFTTSFSLTTFSTSGPQCDDTSIVILIDTNCLAYFRPTQITPGQVVLVDSSYGTGGGMRFIWNFGDGNTAFVEYPTHSYSTAGSYQVTLSIMDSLSGCTNFYHDTITVDSAGILRAGFGLTVINANSVGVEENSNLANFKLYPNPASDFVTIQFEETQLTNVIQLIDISGKLVYTEIITGKEFVTINTQAFEAGVYIVRMRNELGQNNKRLVIK